jgi:hypothetical protein
MMQAGKDYIAKGDAEYESPRALYLRELLRSVKAQDAPAETEDPTKIEVEPIKSSNQEKPTLKLKK